MSSDGIETRSRLAEISTTFLKIGAMSYGGPAIMGIMQAEVQEKRQWLSKERFVEGLALVNMLPGPAATQLGIFLGYARAGWLGGLLAGVSFMLPAFFIMLALTLVYSAYGALSSLRSAFYGIGPVVVGIFVVAVYRLAIGAVKDARQLLIVIAAALAAAATPLGIVPTLLLAGALGIGLYESRRRAAWVAGAVMLGLALLATIETAAGPGGAATSPATTVHGANPGLAEIGYFFLKVGAFTFGGGLTVLAFIEDQLVAQLHWLTPREFLDGLALGQLTPGPILMLAAFVGYKLAGLAGAIVAAGAIFLPAFVIMLSLIPMLERVKQTAWLKAFMRGVGPAVIGTISVSLAHMVPHAAPDGYTLALLAATIALMLSWRVGPLPLMLAGACAGLVRRSRLWERLREFAS